MPDLFFFQEYLPTEIGRLILLTDEQDRLRVVDWEDHGARMHRLLRLHYGAGRVTVVDRGSRSCGVALRKGIFCRRANGNRPDTD
jgi:methylated-DNA-[protein]-cysteine S-methyltransferase